MKKVVVLASFVAIIAGGIVACSGGGESAAPEVPTTVTEKVVPAGSEMVYTASIGIEGMTCSVGCAGAIESKLASMDGVASCEVDFEGKTAHVTYDESKVNDKAMVGTITGIADGMYSVTSVNIEKPVAGTGDASGSDETASDDESALNVQAPAIKVPNIFDLFSRLYRL